ncbi:MAG: radical SAM/SPASM domain-containing protein [Candidatus Nealsonbacteria bacterium]
MPFREITYNKQGLIGIGLDITERCNRDCLFCFTERTPQDMNRKVYKRIVDEGLLLGFPELYILGGEPGMRRDILDILHYGAERFPLVILVTNVDFLANETLCQKIAKIEQVVVAAQRHTLADDKEAHRMEYSLTHGDHLATSHAGWQNIEKYFPPNRVCVQCCILQPVVKLGSIFNIFRWIRKRGYEPVMEFTKEGRRFMRGCTFDVPPEQMMKVLEEFRRIDREEFGLPGAEILTPQAYGKTCHMQETSIHFRVNGDAIPCVGFPKLTYGNIVKKSLEEILAHPLRQHIKDPENWIYGYCKNECPYFKQCTGGCRGSAFDIAGCYRASFYYCPHIPRERLTIADMIPPTCDGCPLEGNLTCNPRR